ncbi:MAG: hypothetical protein KME31_09790 [Tolypothrix carrinoi HA7290-LM1]|nr:hypothetical protein [Tolypothrix carrinoi HA7290-LM1]
MGEGGTRGQGDKGELGRGIFPPCPLHPDRMPLPQCPMPYAPCPIPHSQIPVFC